MTTTEAPSVVMGQMTLKAGSVIHVAGWPVALTADVVVVTNARNLPLIEADMATVAERGDFIAGSGAPVPSDDAR